MANVVESDDVESDIESDKESEVEFDFDDTETAEGVRRAQDHVAATIHKNE